MFSRFSSASVVKSRSLPSRRAGSPLHFSLRSTPKVMFEMAQNFHERQNGFAAGGIVGAHAAEPQAILLRAVVEREPFFSMNFWRSLGGHAERVAVALHGEEELGAVGVFPGARYSRLRGAARRSAGDAEFPPGTGIRRPPQVVHWKTASSEMCAAEQGRFRRRAVGVQVGRAARE